MAAINYIDSLIQGEQRLIVEPSNTAVPLTLTIVDNTNGTRDITLTWSYTQGTNKADTLGLFWESGASLGTTATPTTASKYIQLNINTTSHAFLGVDPTEAYKVSIAVGYTSDTGIVIGTLVRTGSVTWDVSPGSSNNTNNINGVPASTISAATANFNTRNDRLATAIADPTGVTLTKTDKSIGSVDLTVTWAWSGNENDIDGFAIYVCADPTSAAHTLGAATDTVYLVPPSLRNFTGFSVAADLYYTVGVRAYRVVDKDIAASSFIVSNIVQLAAYRPNSAPNITALINGVAASTITASLANYNTLNDMNGAAISAPASVTATSSMNSNGSCDITLTWTWGGTNADIDGFGIYVHIAGNNTAHSANGATDTVFWVKPDGRTRIWYGVDATKFYHVSICAYRAVATSVNASGFISSTFTQVPAFQPNSVPNVTATINGVAASTLTTQASAGNIAATDTATFRTDSPPTNQPTLGAVTVSAISAGGTVDIVVNWTYTQGLLPADGFRIHSNLGQTTPTLASPPSGVVGPDNRSFTFRGVPADKNYRAGIVAFRNVPAVNGVGGQRENAMVTGWAYTAQTVSLDAASLGGTTAATINSNISTAQTTANNVTTAVNEIANDNILSAVEKSGVRAQWDVFSAEKAGLEAQATTYGITTEKTAYSNAFQAMATYLNAGTTWTTGIPNWIADANLATNTAIVGATFRTTITTYINARTELFKKISDIAATKAAWSNVSSRPSDMYTAGLASGINGAFAFRETWAYNAQGYPDKWQAWTSWTTDTPIKDTTLVRSGENSIGWDNISTLGLNVGLVQVMLLTVDKNTTLSGSIDVYLKSLTGTNLPGLYLIYYYANGSSGASLFQPKNIVGSWQTVNFSVAASGVSDITQLNIYVMGSWFHGSGQVNGSVRFDNLQLRTQESAVFDNKQQQAIDVKGGIGNISGQLDASTKLLDASLTAAKTAISAINASSGNLNTNQLAALQAMVATLSALTANLGTVTAGTLDTTGYIRARGAVSVDGNNAAIIANDTITQPFGVYAKGTLCGGRFSSNGATYASGVNGTSTIGYGVYGYTNTGRGVLGYADAAGGTGVHALATNGAKALHVEGTSSYTQVADFYDGIRFSSNNTLKFNWASDWTVAPKATLAGKTHQAWITLFVDSTVFKIPLYSD